jgi:hypothetical protein
MAGENRLWGAERIRGELLKLGVRVSKRTIQKYRPKRRRKPSQTWATLLKNHAADFTVAHDLLFRPLYIFVITTKPLLGGLYHAYSRATHLHRHLNWSDSGTCHRQHRECFFELPAVLGVTTGSYL